MSCGLLCPCQHSWLVDSQGSRRDPLTSEKAWLDYAVRQLSRGAAGRASGQEAVWSAKCKPSWWEAEVGLPWKNPTTNPKDNKEALLKKFESLERHLQEEGKIPSELVEEIKLFREGKLEELYLQTALSSLAVKVASVHGAVLDVASKVKQMKAKVNDSVLGDISNCLSSTLDVMKNLNADHTSNGHISNRSMKKRVKETDLENVSPVLKKAKTIEKRYAPILPASSAASHVTVGLMSSSPKPNLIGFCASSDASQSLADVENSTPISAKHSEVGCKLKKYISEKRKSRVNKRNHGAVAPPCTNTKVASTYGIEGAIVAPNSSSVSNPQPNIPTVCVSEADLEKLLSLGVTVATGASVIVQDSIPLKASASNTCVSFTDENLFNFSTESKSKTSITDAHSSQPGAPVTESENRPSDAPTLVYVDTLSEEPFVDFLADAQSNPSGLTGEQCRPLSLDGGPQCDRTNAGRKDSSDSSTLLSSRTSDAGYISDENMVTDCLSDDALNLDFIYSSEEKDSLWNEEGSFLIDKFLEEINCG